MGSGKEKNELKRGKIKDGNHTDIVFIDFLPLYGNGLMDAAASWYPTGCGFWQRYIWARPAAAVARPYVAACLPVRGSHGPRPRPRLESAVPTDRVRPLHGDSRPHCRRRQVLRQGLIATAVVAAPRAPGLQRRCLPAPVRQKRRLPVQAGSGTRTRQAGCGSARLCPASGGGARL